MNKSIRLGLSAGAFVAIVAGVVVAVLVASAGSDSYEDFGDPDIRGVITNLQPGSDDGEIIARILVEGEIEPDTGYDKASISVWKDTDQHLLRDGELLSLGRPLAEGDHVEVWFEGPVAESYPVQVKAGRIVVLE